MESFPLKKVIAVMLTAGLAACDNPSRFRAAFLPIEKQAGKSRQELNRPNAAVYDVVDVDQKTARMVASFSAVCSAGASALAAQRAAWSSASATS